MTDLRNWKPVVRPSAEGWRWGTSRYHSVYSSTKTTPFRWLASIKARLATRRFKNAPDFWRDA